MLMNRATISIALAIALLVVIRLRRKQLSGLMIVGCVVASIFTFAFGYYCGSIDLPIHDTVTLTATGQPGVGAKSSEVRASNVEIDGGVHQIGRALEGSWLWSGNTLCWRDDNDPKLQTEITQSVTFDVPVGRSRIVVFDSKSDGGVQISCNGILDEVDTHSTKTAELPASSTALVLLAKGVRLALTVAPLFLLFGAVMLLSSNRMLPWTHAHKWQLSYAGIALLQLMFAMVNSGNDGFWYDELFEIGWSTDVHGILQRAFVDDVPYPAFSLLMDLWYRIAPYGEQWLLIPFEICAAAGIYVTGLLGKSLKDGRAGMFAALFSALSCAVLAQCSFEIRRYAVIYLLGALMCYLYLRCRSKHGEQSVRDLVVFSVVMALFAQMHPHTVFACASLFLVDCYLFLKRKIKLRSFIPYVTAAVLYVPVMIATLKRGTLQAGTYWSATPTFLSLDKLFGYLLGPSTVIVVIAFFIALVRELMPLNESSKKRDESRLLKCLVAGMSIHIVGWFLFGAYVRPTFTVWDNRYFIEYVPLVTLVAGIGASAFCSFLGKCYRDDHSKVAGIAMMTLAMVTVSVSYQSLAESATRMSEPFKEAAEVLYACDEIHYSDTAILSTGRQYPKDGWNEYYVSEQGRRPKLDIMSREETDMTVINRCNNIIVVQVHDALAAFDEEVLLALENDFEQTGSELDGLIVLYKRKDLQ